LAFPCNQFGSQEPNADEEILKFTQKFKFSGTLFKKIDVNGKDQHEIFKWLKSQENGSGWVTNNIKLWLRKYFF